MPLLLFLGQECNEKFHIQIPVNDKVLFTTNNQVILM